MTYSRILMSAVVALVFGWHPIAVSAVTTEVELDNGTGGQLRWRGNANNQRTRWVQQGVSVTTTTNVAEAGFYRVTIHYSRDDLASPPSVSLAIGGRSIGSFQPENTRPASGEPGSGWNVFNSHVFEMVPLCAGSQDLVVRVTGGTSVWGIEADVAKLELVSQGLPSLDIEFDNGSGGQLRWRGNANNQRTRWVQSGVSVTSPLTTTAGGLYAISVRYSRDDLAAPPNVTIELDGAAVGSFQPENTRQPGAQPGSGWNSFKSASLGEIPISAGSHTLVLRVVGGTVWGIEADVAALNLVGP